MASTARTDSEENEEQLFQYMTWFSSKFSKRINDLFYFKTHNTIKLGWLEFQNIPNLPPSLSIDSAYNEWNKILLIRKTNHLSISTLQMIFHTQKTKIMHLMFLQITVWSLLLFSFYIFNHLLMELNKVSDNNSNMHNISIYACIIFVIFSIKSIIATYIMTNSMQICTKIVSSLFISLYHKTVSLDLNECDKQHVLNIVYSDINGISDGFWFLMTYGAPVALSLIISMSLLVYTVGVSAIFGILFMLLIGVPFQLFAGYKLSYFSDLRMNCSDKRVQLISELIRGIRILKVSCYELPLMRRVNEYRTQELKWVSKRNLYLSLIILANFFVPAMMLFIILMLYTFVFKYTINSNIILLILMLFTFIQMGVRGIPVVFGSIAAFLCSCTRVDAFHQRKSVHIETCNQLHNSDLAIHIKNATFVWNQEAFALHNIAIGIKRKSLVAVIGGVGCGKTSLIQSILGEMHCVDGEMNVNRKEIVYCCQTPFIRNVSVKENIILELPFDEIKYKECIVAAALHSDLKRLSHFDCVYIYVFDSVN